MESETLNLNTNITDSYLRNRNAEAKENMWEGAFRYTHSYGKGNEWGIDYTYSSESEDEIINYITTNDESSSSLMATIYYRYTSNQITSVSRYISDGVLLTTKENLQSAQNAGAEIIWSSSLGKCMNFNCNVNGFMNQINAEKLGFGKNKNTFAWSTLMKEEILVLYTLDYRISLAQTKRNKTQN